MTALKKNDEPGSIAVDFVDLLFAVAIGIGAQEIMKQPWFIHDPSFTWQSSFVSDIGVVVLGFLTLIASWLGYHRSVRHRPHKTATFPGLITFVIDIVLLACYLLILAKFQNFWLVLLMLTLVYWLFVIWDHFHWQQYQSSDKDNRRRRGVSRLWAVLFTFLFGIYWWLDSTGGAQVTGDAVFLILAISGTVVYRLHKEFLLLALVLDILMFRCPQREGSV